MTQAQEIFEAAKKIVASGKTEFTRKDVRDELNVDDREWENNYSPTFQQMHDDRPPGAPKVGGLFAGKFHRLRHGVYTLAQS